MSHLKGFSQKQLHKWGWKEGKGLGKVENGISSAIKVKRKNNKGGLGLDHGCDFTFHWWDHIFNKTANSIEVCEDDGSGTDTTVKINKTSSKTKITPTLISNKNPCYQYNSKKPLLYGTFVSAGTTTINLQESVEKSSDSDDDSSDDDEEDFSCKDVLDKTFKKTGLTGHKAARHGLKLNGKLQRINDQDENAVNKQEEQSYTKKQSKKKKTREQNTEESNVFSLKTKGRKMKKRKSDTLEHVSKKKKKKSS